MSTTASRFAHRPGTVLSAATLLFGAAAAGLASPNSTPALVASVVGVGGLVVGLSRPDRRVAAFGSLSVLAGVLAAGLAGAGPISLLPAITAAVLAWEFRIGAFAASEELRDGTVERAELLHVATATGVGSLVTGAIYGIYRTFTVGVSVLGVALLLIAVVALGLALRE